MDHQGDYCAGCKTLLDKTEEPVIDEGQPHHNGICVENRRMHEQNRSLQAAA